MSTATTTLPTPLYVKTPDTDRSPFSDKRTYEYQWTVDGTVLDEFGSDREPNGVRLTISHHKGSKTYTVEFKAIVIRRSSTMEAFFAARDSKPHVGLMIQVPGARYSRKTLDALHEEYLADFQRLLAESEVDSLARDLWAQITGVTSQEPTEEPAAPKTAVDEPLSDFLGTPVTLDEPTATYCGLCDSTKHEARDCPATSRIQEAERDAEVETEPADGITRASLPVTADELHAHNPHLDDRDLTALVEQVAARHAEQTDAPAEGDLMVFTLGDDAVPIVRRIASDHTKYGLDGYQPTTGHGGVTFHLTASGFLRHSGGLCSKVPGDSLTFTGELGWAPAWVWHHGISGGGRGVDVRIPVRIFTCTAPAPSY